MPRVRAPSKATKAAITALFDARKGLHGYEIMRLAGIPPGTLYPMLVRLEERGLMTANWESSEEPGRPPRHVYKLTAEGRALAREIAAAAEEPAHALSTKNDTSRL